MDQDSQPKAEEAGEGVHEAAPGRRPYAPPRITDSTVFETLAMACAKQGGAQCEFFGLSTS